MPRSPPPSRPPSHSRSRSGEEDSESSGNESEDVIDPKQRRRDLKHALIKTKPRKRQSSQPLQVYTQFAMWYTRNGQLSTDWQSALQKGIANDNFRYGTLSRDQFKKKYSKVLNAYIDLKAHVPAFEHDLKYLARDPDALDNLGSVMISASGTARSNDISGLKSNVLEYTAIIHENQKLEPKILLNESKSLARGFNHIQLARLLCPARLLVKFDQNPEEFCKELASGRQKVRSVDMPAFLWNRGEYDPEDICSNMFRSEVLVMTYRHIYTCPSSATKEPGGTKTKGSHAKKNRMKSVTPESITYTGVLYRHSISTVEDWRMEDRIFNREDFCNAMLDIIEENRASNTEWYYDLIQWWNVRVFGTEMDCIDDSENEEGPSTLKMIRQQREAAKAMQGSLRFPPPDPNRPPGSDSPPRTHSPRLPTPEPTHPALGRAEGRQGDTPHSHEPEHDQTHHTSDDGAGFEDLDNRPRRRLHKRNNGEHEHEHEPEPEPEPEREQEEEREREHGHGCGRGRGHGRGREHSEEDYEDDRHHHHHVQHEGGMRSSGSRYLAEPRKPSSSSRVVHECEVHQPRQRPSPRPSPSLSPLSPPPQSPPSHSSARTRTAPSGSQSSFRIVDAHGKQASQSEKDTSFRQTGITPFEDRRNKMPNTPGGALAGQKRHHNFEESENQRPRTGSTTSTRNVAQTPSTSLRRSDRRKV